MPQGWSSFKKLGGAGDNIIVEVNNVPAEKKIINVFGVIKGFVDSGTASLLLKEKRKSVSEIVRIVVDVCPPAVSRPLRGYRRPEGRVGSGLRCVNRRHQCPHGAGSLHLRDGEEWYVFNEIIIIIKF